MCKWTASCVQTCPLSLRYVHPPSFGLYDEQSQLVQASFLLHPACQMCLLHVICGPVQDEYKLEPGTVIAADFYHANTLMPLSHEEIVSKVKSNLDHCEPSFRSAQVGYKLKSLQNAWRAAYTE